MRRELDGGTNLMIQVQGHRMHLRERLAGI
jgi:hypothetical protein